MTKWRFGIIVAVLGLLAVLPASAAAQGFKWWQSDRMKADLSLTSDQVDRLEAVFQALLPQMTAEKQTLDQLETRLSDFIKPGTASETDVLKQADQVEAARSALGKTRTLMIYRMHRILTPEQRVKMKALHDKWQADRRQSRRHQ
jgi:Spy/CpxP family protein refolding chaperone